VAISSYYKQKTKKKKNLIANNRCQKSETTDFILFAEIPFSGKREKEKKGKFVT
jgi:hypothetical protein